MVEPAQQDILVLGAGVAGLSAACRLAEFGLRVLVVEARDHIGGRVFTRHIHDCAMELGAEFLHGRPPELWAAIERAGLKTYEREGQSFTFRDNALVPSSDEEIESTSLLDALEERSGPDMSFADYITPFALPPRQRERVVGFVEGFNAADQHQISALSLGVQQKAEEESEGDRLFALRNGYDQLPDLLAERLQRADGRIQLGTPVHAVRWSPSQVQMEATSGALFAPLAVITLPLGVLHSGSVRFLPEPSEVLDHALRLRMGQVRRITLLFREPFWRSLPKRPDLENLGFLFTPAEAIPVWWTHHPDPAPILTGWVGGPRSQALSGLADEELAEHSLETLSRVFSLPVEQLRGNLLHLATHDWTTDPYALGAYSYVAPGGLDASARMAEPVERTLFFAGEHTDTTGNWGTVHAAMRSGYRAAEQILAQSSGRMNLHHSLT